MFQYFLLGRESLCRLNRTGYSEQDQRVSQSKVECLADLSVVSVQFLFQPRYLEGSEDACHQQKMGADSFPTASDESFYF